MVGGLNCPGAREEDEEDVSNFSQKSGYTFRVYNTPLKKRGGGGGSFASYAGGDSIDKCITCETSIQISVIMHHIDRSLLKSTLVSVRANGR